MADDLVMGARQAPLCDDGDAGVDEGEEVELNGNRTVAEDYKAAQEVQSDSVKSKEAITIDDDDDDDDGDDIEDDDDDKVDDDHDHDDVEKGKDRLVKTVRRDDRTPRVGMVFTSYDEVCNFYKRYALHVGFGVAVRKSQFTKSGVCQRLILSCSKGVKGRENAWCQARQTLNSGCRASIVVKLWGDGLLHLMEAYLEHNHLVSPSATRFFRSCRRMADEVAGDLVVRPREHGNSQSGEKECGNSTEIGQLKLEEGDAEVIHQFFACMQNRNPNFFYLVNLDKHGRLINMFWADARSRAAYQYFGDVVSFDTTCVSEKYDVPLALFVGVNHHGQLVLLGCGLLSDETVETYVWLFNAWLTCMHGFRPNAIITDHCKVIQGAVSEVFPGVRHRVCLSHIVKKIPKKLKGFAEFKGIKKVLKKVAYESHRVDEFEENWKKMIEEYRLEGNEWLTSLYENRPLWVPVFLKDIFWAGLSIARRGETITAFFDGSLYPRTPLKQFLSNYEMILQNKYKIEVQADSDSFHKTPLPVSKFYMEEQLSKLYTLNMFMKFQEELKATLYCHVTPIIVNEPIFTFEVKECLYMEDGKTTKNKDHEVLYNAHELEVQCSCGYFHFWGILCRHALSVFKLQHVFEIPSRYILDRWKKDFKRLYALARSPTDKLANNPMERYDHLSLRCLELVEVGFISDDRYQLALKLIREVERSLLDGTVSRDRQPMLLSFGTQSNENVQNLLLSQLAFSEGNRNSNSSQVKRRGRPPKNARESNTERFARSNKEQDFLSSSLVGNEISVLHSAPTTSHLDTHIRMQGGIDLMEEVNPNDLSFGTHFGLHVNHQHHMGSQTRMQPSNLLQGQYDQQTTGNQSRVQRIYQHILQDGQIPKAPSGQRTG